MGTVGVTPQVVPPSAGQASLGTGRLSGLAARVQRELSQHPGVSVDIGPYRVSADQQGTITIKNLEGGDAPETLTDALDAAFPGVNLAQHARTFMRNLSSSLRDGSTQGVVTLRPMPDLRVAGSDMVRPNHLQHQGERLLANGDYRGALELFQRAARYGGEAAQPNLLFLQARCYDALGQTHMARRVMGQLLDGSGWYVYHNAQASALARSLGLRSNTPEAGMSIESGPAGEPTPEHIANGLDDLLEVDVTR